MNSLNFKFNVANFRVFDNRHNFELEPVTFCVGPNNSGKSSLIKFLLFVRDNLVDNYLPLELNFLNTETYFESFSEIQSKNNNVSRLPFGFNFYKIDSFYPEASLEVTYRGDILEETGFDLAPVLDSVEYKFGKSSLMFSFQEESLTQFKMDLKEMLEDCRNGMKGINDLNEKQSLNPDKLFEGLTDEEFHKLFISPAFGSFKEYFLKKKDEELNYSIEELLRFNPKLTLFELNKKDEELNKSVDAINSNYLFNLEQEEINRLTQNFNQIQFSDQLKGCVPMKRIPDILARKYQNNLKGKTEEVLDTIKYYLEEHLNSRVADDLGPDYSVKPTEFFNFFFTRVLSRELTRTADIGINLNKIVSIPIERYTNDKYLFLSKGANLFSDAVGELHRHRLASGFPREKYRKYFGLHENEDFMIKWLKRFGIGNNLKVIPHENQIASLFVLNDSYERNIGSMGTGVRQIITLILSPLLFDDLREHSTERVQWGETIKFNSNTIYLEEPESNLHPNWQSLLVELILDIFYEFNIRFIIETHSEYMIRKLQNLVIDDQFPYLNKFVKVIYFRDHGDYEKDKSKDKLRTFDIEIDENGLLTKPFGTGFYDEAGNLALKLIGNHPLYRN